MSNFKVGDLITAYHSGIHQIVKIVDLGNNNTIIHYQKVCSINAEHVATLKKSNKINGCHISYCKPISEYIENLKKLLTELEKI